MQNLFISNLSGSKKVSRRTALIILIIAAIIIVSFYYMTTFPSKQTIVLTEDEKRVDQFLSDYYLALNHMSLSEVSDFFQDEAFLISPEGENYKGRSKIENYYRNKWRGLGEYQIGKNLYIIEIEDDYAKVSYCSKSLERYPTATIGNIRTFRDDFVLAKQDGDWKIIGLIIKSEPCEVVDFQWSA